ncbi:hypothetical protein [Planctomyces sp. SH-PL62]|uniref:hypothetical protein n=1 Tax=Planctomyces sp. SH-PL62 TaxID=1636152 RepID=UPI00078E57ED|nr:hypothetical protein [Planctomyces sp. SH-PL62]AMV38234.1 hypothetical protein VT85_12405 [Planctomyces sp. SH-PL62]
MPRPQTSMLRRILIQTDCAFWCIHDHLDVVGRLALPTLTAVISGGVLLVMIWRNWDVPPAYNFLAGWLVIPFLGLLLFTTLPLPCAVFAWKAAQGETVTAWECFAWCGRRAGRLTALVIKLSLLYLGSLLLLGLPLLVVWPRTCLTPLVALFEDDRRIFRRTRKILREDLSVTLMGLLYLCMGVVLGGFVALPRLVVGTAALGANLVDSQGRRLIMDHLWVFETVSIAALLTAVAVTWWISLTLVYHDIRSVREGEDLKGRIAAYRARVSS